MPRTNYLCVHQADSFFLSETTAWGDRFGKWTRILLVDAILQAIFDYEYSLQVDYTIRSSSQSHPFGDTSVEEPLEDVLDDSFWYRLNGLNIELEDLHERFGGDWIDDFMEGMPTIRIAPMETDYDPED